jgi:hypothetical protein
MVEAHNIILYTAAATATAYKTGMTTTTTNSAPVYQPSNNIMATSSTFLGLILRNMAKIITIMMHTPTTTTQTAFSQVSCYAHSANE